MESSYRPSARGTPLRRSITPSTANTPGTMSIATPSSISSTILNTPGNTNSLRFLEPRNEYLRDVLKDRFSANQSTATASPSVTPSTNRNRYSGLSNSALLDSQTPPAPPPVDAWMMATTESSENTSQGIIADNKRLSWARHSTTATGTTPNSRRQRRANSVTHTAALSSAAPPRTMGTRETEALIDRQSKENFDLKLRLCLQEERIAKLSHELEEARDRAAESDQLRANLDENEDVKTDLLEKLHNAEAELESAKADSQRLQSEKDEAYRLQEDLVAELEKRDAAVNEAVTMILNLRAELDERRSNSQDSFSTMGIPFKTGPVNGSFDTSLGSVNQLSLGSHSDAGSISAEAAVRMRERRSPPQASAAPSTRLLSVPSLQVSSRPSSGMTESEYYSARSSFSPSSSSSVIQEQGSQAKFVFPPKHPQISRIQVAAAPRLRTLPEQRCVSNGSSNLTRESPDSETLTCESQDSVETIESVTTASSSMLGKRHDELVQRALNPRLTANGRAVSQPSNSHGHSRSRSANEVQTLSKSVNECSRNQNNLSRSAEHPLSQSLGPHPNVLNPNKNSYQPPHQIQRSHATVHRSSQAATQTAQQSNYRSNPNSRRNSISRPPTVKTTRNKWTLQYDYEPMSAPAENTYSNTDRFFQDPSRINEMSISDCQPYEYQDRVYEPRQHGVPVYEDNELSAAYEVASTVATHEDMANESVTAFGRFHPADFGDSSDDEFEPAVRASSYVNHDGNHGMGVRIDGGFPFFQQGMQQQQQHQPPQPPERRSSYWGTTTVSAEPALQKENVKTTKEVKRMSAGAQLMQRVNFVSPNPFSRSTSSAKQALAQSQSQGNGVDEAGSTTQTKEGVAAEAPVVSKSRARRLTDGPSGFLSFAKFGRSKH